MSQTNDNMMQESLENMSNDKCIQTVIEDNMVTDNALMTSRESNRETQITTYCPKCGSRLRKEEAFSLVKYTCTGCREDLGIKNIDQEKQLFNFYQYANAVMNGVRDRRGWNDSEIRPLDNGIKNNLVALNESPFFQMLEVARITDAVSSETEFEVAQIHIVEVKGE